MLRFSLFGVPVGVEFWFWITCVLLVGGLNAQGTDAWIHVIVRTGVVFISILVHEAGHAFVGRRFGADSAIKLHALGGATYLPGSEFTRGQSILVSSAGPAAGLFLGLVVLLVGKGLDTAPNLVADAIGTALYVNFFWTFLNLLPIQPLDGGQILREILGPGHRRIAYSLGFAFAVAVCLWSLSVGRFFLAVMMAMLAYYNIRQQPIEGGVIKG